MENLTETKLTQWQFITLGLFYMMGTLHSSFVSVAAGRDAWLMPIVGLLAYLPVLLVYCLLLKKYPHTSLFDMNEIILGKPVGKIFTFLYFLFFAHVASLNNLEICSFTTTYLLKGTPLLICSLILVSAGVYAVKKGIVNIGRASSILVVLLLVIYLVYFIQAITQMNFNNIMPIMAQKPQVYIKSAHVASSIVYGESIVLLAFLGRTGEEVKTGKSLIITMLIAAAYLLLVHLREILLLGPLSYILSLPSYEAARMTGSSVTISRSEIIYALVIILCTFFRVLLLLFASLTALKKIFNLSGYKSLIIPFAALISLYSLFVVESPEDSLIYAMNIVGFVWPVFTFVLPLITLVVSFVRRKKLTAPAVKEEAA